MTLLERVTRDAPRCLAGFKLDLLGSRLTDGGEAQVVHGLRCPCGSNRLNMLGTPCAS